MRLLFLFMLFAAATVVSAQQITGSVTAGKGSPLSQATVSLLRAADSATVKLAITDAHGTFSFSGIPEGEYRITTTSIGYLPGFSSSFRFGSSTVQLPALVLTKRTANLNTVTVTAKKPIVEARPDKTILNVEGTINAIGSNALELLRKAPAVLLDKDDNISMAGKNGVQVYIDGKPVPLTGTDLAGYLKTLQSAQIEAIELITHPSAKYDAAGNAGIINIRLVRNKSFGANGSVSAGWNIATYAKYNTGLSFNYRNSRINIFSSYNFSYAPNLQNISAQRTVLDTLFDQKAQILDVRKAHNVKAGADFFLDKKNTIGVLVNGIISDPSSSTSSTSLISYQPTGTTDRILSATNYTGMQRNNMNINLNYNYTGSKGKSLTINIDRGVYDFHSDQLQGNRYHTVSGQMLPGSVTYHMIAPSLIHINSAKADYEQEFLKGKLSAGAKTAWVRTDNDFRRLNVAGAAEDLDE